MSKFISVIITAAGMGQRMNQGVPKLELELFGRRIVDLTLDQFTSLPFVNEIILVTNQELMEEYKRRYASIEHLRVILGGDTREASTFEGLKALNPKSDYVICHDGARPFVNKEIITDALSIALKEEACIVAVPVKDTIKYVENGQVKRTPSRKNLYAVQTPQIFKTELILKAYHKFIGKLSATDDAGFVEALGHPIAVSEGSSQNIKITTPEDLFTGERILE